jgi:hypothetical protein
VQAGTHLPTFDTMRVADYNLDGKADIIMTDFH